MASIPNAIKLTLAETSTDFLLEDNNIISVYADTLGAGVVYWDKGARTRTVIVTQTPDDIGDAATGLSKLLIPITNLEGVVFYINYRRMLEVGTEGTGSVIKYNSEGAIAQIIRVEESINDIQALIAAL